MGGRLPARARGGHAPDPPGERARRARGGTTTAVRRHHEGAPAPLALVGPPPNGRDGARGSPQPVALPRRSRAGTGPDGQGPSVREAPAGPRRRSLTAFQRAPCLADGASACGRDRPLHRVPRQHDRGDRRPPTGHDPGTSTRAGRRADEARSLWRRDHRDRRAHARVDPGRWSTLTERPFDGIVHKSPIRSDGSGRAPRTTDAPARSANHQTAPAPISGCPERNQSPAAAQDQTT